MRGLEFIEWPGMVNYWVFRYGDEFIGSVNLDLRHSRPYFHEYDRFEKLDAATRKEILSVITPWLTLANITKRLTA